MQLAKLTTVEARLLIENDYTAVLPTGSTEQHGAHLPVDTDIFLAEQVAAAACEGAGAVLLPSLPFGYNQKELGFPGTVSLKAQTFLEMVIDIGNSLRAAGWRRLMIVNGHGWNNDIMRTAIHVINEHSGFTAAGCSYWSLCADTVAGTRSSPSPGGMAHACEFETSLMLHLRPESVRTGLVQDEISYRRSGQHHHDLFNKSAVFLPEPFEDMSSTGVIGSPTAASAEKGRVWFETTVANLRSFLITFRQQYGRTGAGPGGHGMGLEG